MKRILWSVWRHVRTQYGHLMDVCFPLLPTKMCQVIRRACTTHTMHQIHNIHRRTISLVIHYMRYEFEQATCTQFRLLNKDVKRWHEHESIVWKRKIAHMCVYALTIYLNCRAIANTHSILDTRCGFIVIRFIRSSRYVKQLLLLFINYFVSARFSSFCLFFFFFFIFMYFSFTLVMFNVVCCDVVCECFLINIQNKKR